MNERGFFSKSLTKDGDGNLFFAGTASDGFLSRVGTGPPPYHPLKVGGDRPGPGDLAMAASKRLRLEDLRAIHRLVDDCRALGDDPVRWRRHLLAELCRRLGAAVGVEYNPKWEPFEVNGVVDVGWEESGLDRAGFEGANAEFARHGFGYNPMVGAYFAAVRRGVGPALTRADVLSDSVWYRSAYYRNYHGSSGADAMLYDLAGAGGQQFSSGLVLVRPEGAPDFPAGARLFVHETHAAVVPLIGGPLAAIDEPSPADLPPRVRAVLRCLLEGDSDKQIAARLGISRYTVNEYVKVIFAHFGVATRMELLARWIRRGWGSRFAWAAE
jgi:DNA-binding CsgD family transcriptional regulator